MKKDKVIYFLYVGECDGSNLIPIQEPIRVDDLTKTGPNPLNTEVLFFAWECEGVKYVGKFQPYRENYAIGWSEGKVGMNPKEAIFEGWLDMDITGKQTKTFLVRTQLYMKVGV